MASRFVTPEPAIHQRWRHRDHGPSWRIIDIQDNVIIVSGPGPARSIKYINKQEFMAEWMPV